MHRQNVFAIVTNVSRIVIARVRSTRIYNVRCLGGVFSRGLIISEQTPSSRLMCFFARRKPRLAGRTITNFSSRRSSRHRCLYHTRLVYNLRRSLRARLTTRRTHTTSGNFSTLRVVNLRNHEACYRQRYLPRRSVADKLSHILLCRKNKTNFSCFFIFCN